ncbi:ankyrin repeat-containing protein NPR4-like [Alnus glutinosa]|uniref:ankyrin repeat-containing protein NPR4-like n=1 Tax=Alnus glutinosa TaxID=3517 RepID=UPI002D789868|nr:ankyrin repeat-containing protein NPR4-like [Alnus glutinosa]XP_062162522.1 ankyrin repeat-containing protein NPR4-like [Alnus glutinosa]XP_062162523.1 ankyrin repeat-containing protein NPR4-like [Alnus glutinosa]XP_062162524.1 ankyrin repeat-containing protein NPR4-like [Alnus glutinosa]
MEEGAINTPDYGRQKAKVRIASERTSSIDQPRLSSTTECSPYSSSLRSTTSDAFASLDAATSQAEFVQTNAGEPTPSEDFEPESVQIYIGELSPMKRTLDECRGPCRPLLQAAIKGDWSAAEAFLKENRDYVRAPITKEKATTLHIAAAAQHTAFITEMLKLIVSTPKDLELMKTTSGFTALHSAAQSGNVRIAEQLVEMNNKLLSIKDVNEDTPLIVAAYLGHTNMVSYLFALTGLEHLTDGKRTELLEYTIYNDMFDVALKILHMDPNIASASTECWLGALKMLARKPLAIGSESQLSSWKSLLKYSWFKGIYNKALMKTLAHQLVEELWEKVGIPDKQFSSNLVNNNMALIFEAAKVGNVEFLIILARSYPDLIWQQDKNKMSIFHIAILYRHESVFNLIFEIGADKDSLASYAALKTKENMLHLAGKLAPSDRLNIVSGAALQMQRELLWFKEIEKIVPRSYVNRKNSKGQTPKEIFIKAHKNLQKDGEKWMKDTSKYCMLVASLIAIVIFVATFTVAGVSKQETGTPIFVKSNWFMVFFISDAITLCSSSTSIVIFLSILMSRYTEDDFLKSLPSKLMIGLATLFISMAGMMVAFSATFFLVYTSARAWAPVVVITSAIIPIISFVLLHGQLWIDTFLSTYKSKFIFRPYKNRLF